MDLARLGFSVDSSSVDKGTAALNKLTPAAQKAEAAVEGMNAAASQMGRAAGLSGVTSNLGRVAGGAVSAQSAIAGVASAYTMSARAAALAGTSMSNTGAAVDAAAAGHDRLQSQIFGVTGALQTEIAELNRVRDGLRQVAPAANEAGSSLDRLGKHASDNISKMQATPGNIAAQFQDIGVTAAGGMSPMLIALQQGTQLSAALAGGIGNLGAAFRQLFSVTTILTIGIVALVAAGIQWLMSLKGTTTASERAANGLKTYTKEMGYSREEVEKLNAVTVTMGDTMSAVFEVGFGRIATMFGVTTDELSAKWTSFTQWLGDAARASIAGVYAAFTGMQNVIPRILSNIRSGRKENLFEVIGGSFRDQYREAEQFMDEVGELAKKNARKRQDEMAAGMVSTPKQRKGRKQFGFGDLMEEAAGMERELLKARATIGLYGEELARVSYEHDLLNKAAERGLKLSPQQIAMVQQQAAALAKLSEENRVGAFREETKQAALAQADALKNAAGQIGVYGKDLMTLRYEQEMLNKATAEHIQLTDKDRQKIRETAEALADREYENLRNQVAEDARKHHAEQMRQLDVERNAIGLTGKALTAYRYEQDLINKAVAAGVAFKDIDIEKIRAQANAYATLKDQIDRTNESIEFARETFKGFFTEWINNVRQGQDVFNAFANAVLSALNKIIDRALDAALNGLFDASGIGRLFGGMSSSGIAAANSTVGATVAANPSLFAKGGAFTNSIVDSPTLFKFAKGTGMMGEAGPEAIVPLKRGRDGSLGVQMHGGKDRGAANNNEITLAPVYNVGGVLTPEAIIAAIRQGDENSMSELSRMLPALLAEYQTNGKIAG